MYYLLSKFYIEKHFVLIVVTTLTAGASPENPIASHLRWADGLGRFSGTMVSKEFNCHGEHFLLSLHLWPFSFDCTTSCWISPAPAAPPVPAIIFPISRPTIIHDAATIHWVLQLFLFSFFGLNRTPWVRFNDIYCY